MSQYLSILQCKNLYKKKKKCFRSVQTFDSYCMLILSRETIKMHILLLCTICLKTIQTAFKFFRF